MKDGGLWRTICECPIKAVSIEVEPDLVVARKTKPLPGASSMTQRTDEVARTAAVCLREA